MQHKLFCIREFIKTESATAVQRAFRLRFNIQPPTRKSICRWNHEFEQIGCLCKGKSSGRPRISEDNVRRIQEIFERSPCKSTRRASSELGIPQPTVWRVLRRRLLTGTGSLCPSFWITLYINNMFLKALLHVSMFIHHLQEVLLCTLNYKMNEMVTFIQAIITEINKRLPRITHKHRNI